MKIGKLLLLLALVLFGACQEDKVQEAVPGSFEILEELKVDLAPGQNRAISFTNKESAYYYTQSHVNDHSEHNWFKGMNVSQNRVFAGYELYSGDTKLDDLKAKVSVYPHKFTRNYPGGASATLHMFDYMNVLWVEMHKLKGQSGIALLGENVEYMELEEGTAFYKANEGNYLIAVRAVDGTIDVAADKRLSSSGKSGFYIAVASDRLAAQDLIDEVDNNRNTLLEKRYHRMATLLEENTYVQSSDRELQTSLRWMTSTMDQLVTRQRGDGIYAGLPWFNEYWGRDQFIAMPGACLVTGQFATARRILVSFADYQDTIQDSKFYGRIPNILKTESINYHTTDGTPRYIAQLRDYVKYSGDKSIIEELYPTVKMSIEGSIANWTDDKGYLLHEDNETWMDARRNYDKKPYSPRGSRANDIQALWYDQLQAGIYFAQFMEDVEHADKWKALADKVSSNFERDYRSESMDFLADRLDWEDRAEFKLRPNQFYCFDLVSDKEFVWKATRICWEELVYPWGVASLNRQDDFFHPFHLQWENYHKDEGYHNGTIWLWNNGAAMQRMIEAGQSDEAFRLFQNMNKQAMSKGVVGGLSENMDAYPHKGKDWPKLTGTYLQAWSNGEHMRAWYQDFLGVQPDMINARIRIAPRIPSSIPDLKYYCKVAEGKIVAAYKTTPHESYIYEFDGLQSTVEMDIWPFNTFEKEVQNGDKIVIEKMDSQLKVSLMRDGNIMSEEEIAQDPERLKADALQKKLFEGVDFCKPFDESKHKVLEKKFDGDRSV